MKYTIERTSQFKKDYKLAKKRGLDIEKLKKIITILFGMNFLGLQNQTHFGQGFLFCI